jgi:hypothetical protein
VERSNPERGILLKSRLAEGGSKWPVGAGRERSHDDGIICEKSWDSIQLIDSAFGGLFAEGSLHGLLLGRSSNWEGDKGKQQWFSRGSWND